MKRLFMLFVIVFTTDCTAQNETDATLILNGFVNYNFSAKQSLENLTPIVNFGWERTLVYDDKKDKGEKKGRKTPFSWIFNVNPYTAATIDIKDSASFIPALMLPGNLGLTVNNYFKWDFENKSKLKHSLIFSPINFGFKVIGNFKDSGLAISQHAIRTGLTYAIHDLFSLNATYTWGWHQSTSEAETNYKKMLPAAPNQIKYLSVTLQTQFNIAENNPVYMTFSWRNLNNYSAFNPLPNRKIISVGFYKTFDFRQGSDKSTKSTNTEEESRKTRMNTTRHSQIF